MDTQPPGEEGQLIDRLAVLVAKRLLAVDEWPVVLLLLLFNEATGGVSLEGPRSSVSDHGRLSTGWERP